MKKKICLACIKRASLATHLMTHGLKLAGDGRWVRADRDISETASLIGHMDDLGCVDEESRDSIYNDIAYAHETIPKKDFDGFVEQTGKLRFDLDRTVVPLCERELGIK